MPEDTKFVYDRNTDGDMTDETLASLPLYSIIGTGDARGVYTDKNTNKRSRHAMMVVGYLEDGTPLIYDLGKIHAGLPKKYRNQVNFIASPSEQILFSKQENIEQKTGNDRKKSEQDNEVKEVREHTSSDPDSPIPDTEEEISTPGIPGEYFYTAKYLVDALKYLESSSRKKPRGPITLNIV